MNRILLFLLPPALLCFGTVGYVLVEDWNWLDAFYMTVITISTVGYGEIHPLSESGQAFTVVLIFLSFGTFTYSVAALTRFVLEGGFSQSFRRFRMEHAIGQLSGHVIVCGLGRKGQAVCRQLHSHGVPFLVIEHQEATLAELQHLGYLQMQGNVTDDDFLRQGRIEHARSLIALLGNDAENVFLILSARQLNSDLDIIAWGSTPEMESKLRHAGANRVLSPFELGGFRVVHTLLRPNVVDFFQWALDCDNEDLALEQFEVPERATISNKTLSELELSSSLNILGLVRGEERFFNLTGSSQFEAGDILIVLGPRQELNRLGNILAA